MEQCYEPSHQEDHPSTFRAARLLPHPGARNNAAERRPAQLLPELLALAPGELRRAHKALETPGRGAMVSKGRRGEVMRREAHLAARQVRGSGRGRAEELPQTRVSALRKEVSGTRRTEANALAMSECTRVVG